MSDQAVRRLTWQLKAAHSIVWANVRPGCLSVNLTTESCTQRCVSNLSDQAVCQVAWQLKAAHIVWANVRPGCLFSNLTRERFVLTGMVTCTRRCATATRPCIWSTITWRPTSAWHAASTSWAGCRRPSTVCRSSSPSSLTTATHRRVMRLTGTSGRSSSLGWRVCNQLCVPSWGSLMQGPSSPWKCLNVLEFWEPLFKVLRISQN